MNQNGACTCHTIWVLWGPSQDWAGIQQTRGKVLYITILEWAESAKTHLQEFTTIWGVQVSGDLLLPRYLNSKVHSSRCQEGWISWQQIRRQGKAQQSQVRKTSTIPQPHGWWNSDLDPTNERVTNGDIQIKAKEPIIRHNPSFATSEGCVEKFVRQSKATLSAGLPRDHHRVWEVAL